MPQVGPGDKFNPYETARAKGGRKLISISPATGIFLAPSLDNCDTCGRQ
jgi:hypothetical protein